MIWRSTFEKNQGVKFRTKVCTLLKNSVNIIILIYRIMQFSTFSKSFIIYSTLLKLWNVMKLTMKMRNHMVHSQDIADLFKASGIFQKVTLTGKNPNGTVTSDRFLVMKVYVTHQDVSPPELSLDPTRWGPGPQILFQQCPKLTKMFENPRAEPAKNKGLWPDANQSLAVSWTTLGPAG